MKIAIPDDYQDMVDRLSCFSLLQGHDVTRFREPAVDLGQLVERLHPAEVVVAIRERVTFSRALIERLPNLRLIALVGRAATTIDCQACNDHRVLVSTGASNSPTAPAELTVALIVAARRNIALEAERMRRGDWPCTLSPHLSGSTLGIFGLGVIGSIVARSGAGMGFRECFEQILAYGKGAAMHLAGAR
jgi:D-3-phosphoglycerate dehydrogenase / 2-oxoglutarate reductase